MTYAPCDVVGVGENSVDHVYRLPAYPQPDTSTAKMRIASHLVSAGGQVATALATCAALGLRARYVGAFGVDDNGTRIRLELERRGVDVSPAPIRDAPNRHAIVLLAEPGGERVVLWERDPRLTITPDELHPAMLAGARLVHVDDVDDALAVRAADMARAVGVPVTSDIDRVTERTEALVAAVTVPMFSEHVLEALVGESDHERALRLLRRRHDGLLCVTLGARGALLLEADRLHRVPAYRVETVDTTGAGDVFRGAFIHALLRGDAPADILRFAAAAAAVSCTRVGAMNGVPTPGEVAALM